MCTCNQTAHTAHAACAQCAHASTRACVHKCTHACIHARTHVLTRVHTHEPTRVHMHACTHTRARVCVYTHARACAHITRRGSTCPHILAPARVSTYASTSASAPASASTLKCIHMHLHPHPHPRASTRACKHVCVHARALVCTCSINPKLSTQVRRTKMHPQPARHNRRTSGSIFKIYFWSKSLQVQLGDLRRCFVLGAELDLASGGSWGLI